MLFIAKLNSCSAVEHGLYVWNEIIVKKCKASQIAIIAHSYGGLVTMEILLDAANQSKELKRIKSICLTDAIFFENCFDDIGFYIPTRNWVVSLNPLDEWISKLSKQNGKYPELKVSAGTLEHERTSYSAMFSVLKFVSDHF